MKPDSRKILEYRIPWKSVQWERKCSMRMDKRTDGRTQMTKLFAIFAKSAPKTNKNYAVTENPR